MSIADRIIQRANLPAILALTLALGILTPAGNVQAGQPLPAKFGYPTVWSAAEGKYVSIDDLARELTQADIVLIGEVHDNPWHHKAQAWLLRQMARTRRPAVVLEMISAGEADALETYLAQPSPSARKLGEAVNWKKRGWPSWSIYEPIAEAALEHKLPLRAGDAVTSDIRAVGKGGLEALGAERQAALGLDEGLEPALQSALLTELKDGHCNLLPETALGPMSAVQRFRDASMAQAIVRAHGEGGVVLIAGNGHVRGDRGVAWYLRRRLPDARVVSIVLLETDNEALGAIETRSAPPEDTPPADFAWPMPRQAREDQCELLRKRFAKPQKGAG